MLNPFTRRGDPHSLVVGMTGVKMGDRLVQIGCAHGGRLGAIAAKVGLSGRAVAIVPDETAAARARQGAADAGVLVDVDVAAPAAISAESDSFDLAVIDDTDALLSEMHAAARTATLANVLRVLRPGGRVIIVRSAPRGGLSALLSRGAPAPKIETSDLLSALDADGFRSARLLGESEGLSFVEAVKPR